MEYDLKVENGVLYTGQEKKEADIGIENGKIKNVRSGLDGEAKKTIDASGCQVLPGAIDPHVHFNLELPLLGITSRDDYITGAKAAARGGLTMVIDYSEQRKKEGLMEGIRRKIEEEMEGKSCIDYSVHGCVYHWDEKLLDEIKKLVEAGFPTIKMFMIYSEEGWRAPEPALLEAMKKAGETGATICVHCENDALLQHFTEKEARESEKGDVSALARARPPIVEASAVRRAVELCEYADGRLYVVHISTAGGANAVRDGRQRGVQVFGETTPQFLTLTEEVFRREEGHLFAASPPLKTEQDNERLWLGLEAGDLSVIGTDNCTFNREQKNCWEGDFRKIPRGLPGCETMFPLLYTHAYRRRGFSLNKLVRITSANAARIHGIYPRKGTLEEGTDADIIVIDPEKSEKINPEKMVADTDWSPYEGQELYGFPEYTICRGKIVVGEGKLKENIEGHGQLVKRKPDGKPL